MVQILRCTGVEDFRGLGSSHWISRLFASKRHFKNPALIPFQSHSRYRKMSPATDMGVDPNHQLSHPANYLSTQVHSTKGKTSDKRG